MPVWATDLNMKIFERANGGGSTALHWAAEKGHAKACQTLLEVGVDHDARDHGGDTPVRRAIDHCQDSVVRIFKDKQLPSPTGTEDDSGKTLLAAAAVSTFERRTEFEASIYPTDELT